MSNTPASRATSWFSGRNFLKVELRRLPSYLLQDIGLEPHLVRRDVTKNGFFRSFHP